MNNILAGLIPFILILTFSFLFFIAYGLRNYQNGGTSVFFGLFGLVVLLYVIMVITNMIMCIVKKNCNWNDNKNFEYPFFL